ncbi:cytochrome b561 domain-containing protein 2-like [Bombus impatiens]|uniref:ascorbate ferrireductase (transmembrane) n=1 Tax=Bombus impatiens TaxID=132113 RepID=A0A6P3DXX5_BOMIM|nr:cytochrome b561 domain-containing protein 2-like [Bombus impatiens]
MEEEGINATSFQLGQTKVDVSSSSEFPNSSSNFETSDTKRSAWSTCVTIVDLVNHILIVCLTAFTLYYSVAHSVFNHTTLCTVGYVLLMSEAIVVFAGDNILTRYFTHRTKKHLHWILQLLGLICIIAGVVLMYRVKKVHFKSNHAILGITSLIIMIFLTVTGYPVFVATKLRKVIRPITIKFGHNFLGLSCFAIGMASQCLGYWKFRTMNISSKVDARLICIIVSVMIVVLSARKALPTLFQQFVKLFG